MGDHNRIYMSESGVLCLDVVGPQDFAHIVPIINQLQLITESLKENGKIVMLLINLEHAGAVQPDGILGGVQFLHRVVYDRVAFLKAHGMTKTVMDLILKRAKVGERGRMFEDEEAALKWLAKSMMAQT